MKLSVIIPCYNAAETIAEQLDALVDQQWSEPWEIIVSNNRSTDSSMGIVESYRQRLPNLRIVDASGRQGQPYAINTAVAIARGEAVVFADADDVVGAGWVAAMGNALQKYAIVASRTDIDRLNPFWLRASRGNFQSQGLQPYEYPPYLPHAGGGTLGIRRTLFLALGGFDESMPYLHDTDLCWKAQLSGFKMHFVPDAVMHLRFRDDLKGMYRQTRNYAEYNIILYKKYGRYRMPRITVAAGIKDGVIGWANLLKYLRYINTDLGRANFIRQLAWRVGRLQGCIKCRVPAL